MAKTIFRKALKGMLFVLAFFVVLMLLPRTIGLLFPEKVPIGYHFEALDYLAIGVGLESLIDREPEVQATIESFKNN